MLPLRPLSATLVVALVMSVGGSPATVARHTATTAAPTDVCALLTLAQVGAALELPSQAAPGGMKTAPAPGIGDDAYYVLYGSDSPQLMVRKGSVQFSVRILNGFKFKPFTMDQEKSKEAALAQAALKAL